MKSLPREIWLIIYSFRYAAFRNVQGILESKLQYPKLERRIIHRGGFTTSYCYRVGIYEKPVIFFVAEYIHGAENDEYLNCLYYILPARYYNDILISTEAYFKLDNGHIRRVRPIY